jgi:rhodanese-related sulfurtransferase
MLTETKEMNAVDYFHAKMQFETTPHALKADLEKKSVFLVDVRDQSSFQTEHITGAVNIPFTDIASNLSKFPKDKTIVTYCWDITCALAPKAALTLAEKGLKVQELVGGIVEWKGKGFPVEGTK